MGLGILALTLAIGLGILALTLGIGLGILALTLVLTLTLTRWACESSRPRCVRS